MSKAMVSLEAAKSTLRAVGSTALANAVVCGIDECKENGRPLTQGQQIEMVKMAIMAYDEMLKGCEALDVDAMALALGHD